MSKQIAKLLLEWYQTSSRPLPWRQNRDPYRVWISEVMLQQTTVAAVLPYYERFLSRFPTVNTLAAAKVESVLELWSGLGYYTRARNLHAAAKEIACSGFPQSYQKLSLLPGFGPYISRAVSSIAFDEPVAAVDGNLIRVLSRIFGLRAKFWTTAGRNELQDVGDEIMKSGSSSVLNQALMDLGSDVCAKQNPRCNLCPVFKICIANKKQLQNEIPLSKPRKKSEIWEWNPEIVKNGGKILLQQNKTLPFLKNQWLFPGIGKRLAKRPKNFGYKHVIMHYEIFVTPNNTNKKHKFKEPGPKLRWVKINELPRLSPFSILNKSL
ncbi:MAG: hypothetical protein A4S09_00970 [Proteobacteria bacterium SG_bin7]|nr:MAG: hypothetical protein A4S09_00970 [Proteobacteria bacterium SG_bin7]